MSVWAHVPAAGTTPRPGPPRPLVITTTLIAATITTLTITPYIGIAILLGATLTELAARRGHHHLHRITTTIARWTARTLFTLLGIPLLLLPWLTGRIYRIDPLTTPGTNGWITRSRRDPRPHDQWRPDTTLTTPPLHHRLRTTLATLTTIALVGALLAAGALGTRTVLRHLADADTGTVDTATDAGPVAAPAPTGLPPALAGADWWPEYQEDMSWLRQTNVAWRPLAPVRLADTHTRHINIVDGARATWTPGDCTCRRLSVWMYGGSTTFGEGQRDEHTIPSELARIASERGYTLDVVNRGVLGDTQWEESQRFGWDLATLSDRPDLVIFYDGHNELETSLRITTDDPRPMSFVVDDFWTQYLDGHAEDPGDTPPDASVAAPETLPDRSAREVGAAIVRRYLIGRRIGLDLAEAHDITTRYFWQPTVNDRDPVEGEYQDAGVGYARERSAGAVEALPDDIHDLTHVFDGIDRPIFFDNVHTNEEGALIVARAMFDELEPTIAGLAAA